MLEIAIFTVVIAGFALLVQQQTGIPTPMTIIASVIALSLSGLSPISTTDQQFDSLVFLMLPILICVDAMMLRWDELRKNALSLFYIAGIMIVLSVGLAILLNRNILPDYHLPPAAVAALFCMILATDPVSVSSVFGRFHLPHNLKVLAEGESLFNDASALIVFSIALVYMGHGAAHVAESPTLYAAKMVLGALAIGFAVGFVGLLLLRFIHDAMTETMLVLAMALGSFWLAEHYHASGILAVIVAILFANNIITRRLHDRDPPVVQAGALGSKRALRRLLANFDDFVKDAAAYRVLVGNITFISIIASTVLFIAMADQINLALLLRYWPEIISVFIGATLIRMTMLGGFAWVSRHTARIHTIPLHWWKVLTAGGVKGAFSLLMLHMIPRTFEYRELFEAIVIGNVLLSTFLYPLALFVILHVYREHFEREYQADHLRFEE
jgi:CPA1 family monovalent cation:H+ antiporter